MEDFSLGFLETSMDEAKAWAEHKGRDADSAGRVTLLARLARHLNDHRDADRAQVERVISTFESI